MFAVLYVEFVGIEESGEDPEYPMGWRKLGVGPCAKVRTKSKGSLSNSKK